MANAHPAVSCSCLESVSVGITSTPRESDRKRLLTVWGPEDRSALREVMRPFSGLRSLNLSSPFFEGLNREGAAIIAEACPNVSTLHLTADFQVISGVLSALASLPNLQHLSASDANPKTVTVSFANGLEALADGAAGRTLRSIGFFGEQGLFNRMPNLESIQPFLVDSDICMAMAQERITSLGRIAGLREASVAFIDMVDAGKTSEALRALAEALSRLPRLEKLTLDFSMNYACGDADVDYASLLESPGVRRRLASLRMALRSEADALAVLGLPALRHLRVSTGLGSLRPLEVLRGLRPDVELEVRVDYAWDREPRLVAEAEAAVRGMFEAAGLRALSLSMARGAEPPPPRPRTPTEEERERAWQALLAI
eukprot:tig00021037_g17441.t1